MCHTTTGYQLPANKQAQQNPRGRFHLDTVGFHTYFEMMRNERKFYDPKKDLISMVTSFVINRLIDSWQTLSLWFSQINTRTPPRARRVGSDCVLPTHSLPCTSSVPFAFPTHVTPRHSDTWLARPRLAWGAGHAPKCGWLLGPPLLASGAGT